MSSQATVGKRSTMDQYDCLLRPSTRLTMASWGTNSRRSLGRAMLQADAIYKEALQALDNVKR